jgi:tripartite ATP-independent transporter DctM subunit
MSIAAFTVILLAVLFVIGTPAAYAMIFACIPYFWVTGTIPMDMIVQKMIASTESTALMAIPFYITAGALMNYSGITKRLMDVADVLVGHLVGGLGHVNVLLSCMNGGLTGSCAADASLQCKILVPEMLKRGYDKPFSASVTAASSLITTIIPPGMAMIIYAYCTDTSVGRMFAAGYLPGFLMTATMMLLVGYLSHKRGYPPSREKRATFKEAMPVVGKGLWALFLPFGLILGIRLGVFNATEGGAMCCVYAFLVGTFIYKEFKPKYIINVMKESFLSTSTVMVVMCAATVLSFFLSWESIPSKISVFLLTYANNRYVFMLGVIVLFLVIGMFMDGTSAMMVIAPIIAPVAMSLGINLVHLGVLLVMLCSLGAITPPFGVIIYLVAPLLKMRVQDFIKEELMFIAQLMVCILLTAFIPALTLWIPNLIFGAP